MLFISEDELVYMDPHTTQPFVDVTQPGESDASYHCSYSCRMPVSYLDPSVAVVSALRNNLRSKACIHPVHRVSSAKRKLISKTCVNASESTSCMDRRRPCLSCTSGDPVTGRPLTRTLLSASMLVVSSIQT